MMNLMLPSLLTAFTLFACVPLVSGSPCTNKVTGFQTYDVFTDDAVDLVSQSGVPNTPIYLTDFSKCKLTIIAKTTSTPSNCSGKIKCVKLELGTYKHNEKVAPYTLYGDSNGNYEDDRPTIGVQKLKACPYTDDKCTKGQGTCLEMMVEVVNGDVNGEFVPNFVLYDAKKGLSNGRIDYVPDDGSPMCRPKSKQVNLIANVGCDVDEVKFAIIDEDEFEMFDETLSKVAPFWVYGHSDLEDGAGTYEIYGRSGFQLNREYYISATPDGDTSQEVERTLIFDRDCS
jgi:hypothetical protein